MAGSTPLEIAHAPSSASDMQMDRPMKKLRIKGGRHGNIAFEVTA